MKRLYIGLAGKIKAGKGTFVKTLSSIAANSQPIPLSVSKISFSTTLMNIIKEAEIKTIPRGVLQQLSDGLRPVLGPDWLANATKQKALREDADIVILDGVRWETDVEMVRSLQPSLLIYIEASDEDRYRWASENSEKDNEQGLSQKQFDEQELAPSEVYIPQIKAQADFVFYNTSTLLDYLQSIKRWHDKVLKPSFMIE